MRLEDLGLKPGSSVLVDSSPFIYLVEGSERRREAVEDFLAAASEGGLRLLASTLVWTELLHKPLRFRDTKLAERYRGILADSSRVVLVPVDVAIAEEAARLGAQRGLQLADSLHLATALVLGVDAILGNDESWRELPECPPLLLIDELAFERRDSA